MNFRNREPRFMQRCLFKMQSVSLYLNQRKMSNNKAVEAVIISVCVWGGGITGLLWVLLTSLTSVD